MKLTIVSASIDPAVTMKYWESWDEKLDGEVSIVRVINSPDCDSGYIQDGNISTIFNPKILGVVPAYVQGIKAAIVDYNPDIIACFHDDLAIYTQGWDFMVKDFFKRNPKCILAGFGGATGVGDIDIYKKPYEPIQLARHNFYSNMKEADKHGYRTTEYLRVACFDGFSQIGRADFIEYAYSYLADRGIIHHAYDTAIGLLAARHNEEAHSEEAWLIPIHCHHAGGVTAVGNQQYQEWAKKINEKGDTGLWEEAHRIVYEEFRDVLPIRL